MPKNCTKDARLFHCKLAGILLFLTQIKRAEKNIMETYTERLIRCGVSAAEAYRMVYCLIKDFGIPGLLEYIESIEAECYGLD